jgi:hypothetical protein
MRLENSLCLMALGRRVVTGPEHERNDHSRGVNVQSCRCRRGNGEHLKLLEKAFLSVAHGNDVYNIHAKLTRRAPALAVMRAHRISVKIMTTASTPNSPVWVLMARFVMARPTISATSV